MTHTLKQRSPRRNQPPASGRPAGLKLTAQDQEAICQALTDYHRQFEACFYRREQRHWSAVYLCGQLSNMERKTIEPMLLDLLGVDRNAVRAVQEFIGVGQWEAQGVIRRHQELVAQSLGHSRGVVIVDGSGFPKQGEHSAGVAWQYCGLLGKVANCQEGVFVVYNSPLGYTFLNGRLYLPEDWFDREHQARWQDCGIPDTLRFRTEPELALDMVGDLVARDVLPFQWVTCDEHFGQNPGFLDGVAALGKWYFAEVPHNTHVWLHTPAVEPAGPGLLGRPRLRARVRLDAPAAQGLRELAARLPGTKWHRLTIQEGSKGPLVADFAWLRVTPVRNRLPGPRVWAIFRRSLTEPIETKYYLSNAPIGIVPRTMADMSGQRWPIETIFEEAKGEIGMDHYETRTWVGWHHHMAQTFLAHHFLMQVRAQLKKVTGLDDRSSAPTGRADHRHRKVSVGNFRSHRISSAAKLCRLSVAPQAHAATASETRCQTEKVKSLVVMKVSL
jgi:SRSO17 transposase